MADQFGNKGFESWVKNCLGSAKPEIVQNVLAVLDKECFESPADLAEFGDRPAELAKLGIPARHASALLQKAIKAADAAEAITMTSETQSSSGDSASVQRSEALSAENSVSDLADVEPAEVLQEPTEKAEEKSFEVLGAKKPSSDTAIQQSAEVLGEEGAEKAEKQTSEVLGAKQSSSDTAIPPPAEFLQDGDEKADGPSFGAFCAQTSSDTAVPQAAEVLQPHAAVVDDAGPSTDSQDSPDSPDSPDQCSESSETQSWCVLEGDTTLDLAKVGDYVKHSNQILQQLSQKDILCFLGSTGAGKSTYIHHIAKKRLVAVYKNGQMSYEAATDQDLTDLEGIEIGHGKESGTTRLSPWTNPDTGAVYMDCAGYLDTRGPELDIATSLSMRKLAETCKSLRFIVVIGCDLLVGTSNRGQSFRQLCTVICQCVKDFIKYSGAFSFVFSHVDMLQCWERCRSNPDVQANIKECTMEIREHLKAILKGTLNMPAFFAVRSLLSLLINEMRSPEKAKKKSFMVFHPNWCTAEECRDCLEVFDKNRCLTMPKAAVQYVLTPEQDSKLRRQLEQSKLHFESLINEGNWKSVEEHWNAVHNLAHLIELPELQSSLEESRLQLERYDHDLSQRASELVNFGAGDSHGTFSAKEAQVALKCFETLGFLAGLLHSDSNVQEQWKKMVVDKLCVLKEQVLMAVSTQATGDILAKPALAVADMQLQLLRLKAWSDADQVTFSSGFHGARTAVNELFQQMVALSTTESAFGLQDLPAKCKIALHLKHIASEANPSLWDGEVIDMEGAAQEAVWQAHQLVEKSKAESIELVTSFLTAKDPGNFPLLASIGVAFESLMSAEAELQHWPDQPHLSNCLSTAIRELMEASRVEQLTDEVEKLVREKRFDHLEAPLKCLGAFRQVLPPEAAENSGVAHASADSMRRVLVAAEHVGNEVDDFFGDLSAGKEAYLEKPLDLFAAFKAASWLDQLSEDSRFVEESVSKWQNQLGEALRKSLEEHLMAIESYLRDPRNPSNLTCLDDVNAVQRLQDLLRVSQSFDDLLDAEAEFNGKVAMVLLFWMQTECSEILAPNKDFNFAEMPAVAIQTACKVYAALAVYPKSGETLSPVLEGSKEILRQARHAADEILEHGTYQEKDRLLASVQRFTEQNLTYVLAELKPIKEMRSIICTQTSQQLHEIRQKLEVSLDDAERALSQISPVAHLSDMVWEQIRAEIKMLQTSIDLRNQDVGTEMEQAMTEFDFKTVKKYLEPQDPSSTFQVQRCEGRCKSVRLAVSSMISSAKYDLPWNPSKFAQKFFKLQRAMDDIGDLMDDARPELESLENYANEIFQQQCHEHGRAVKDFRTADMFRTRSALEAFYMSVRDPINILSPESKQAYQSACSSCDDMVESVRNSCKELGDALCVLASGNGESVASDAKDKLREVLRFLDHVQVSNGTGSISSDLYAELTSKLRDQFEDFHTKMESPSQGQMKYPLAIEAYDFLNSMLQNGLEAHVALSFDVDGCCKRLKEEKKKQDQRFLQYLLNEEMIDEIKRELKQLRSWRYDYYTQSWIQSAGPLYRFRVAEMRREVQACVEIIERELKPANYFSVGAHLEAITRIRNRLYDHLPAKSVESVVRATQLVKAAFDKIVQETIDATANQDSDRIDRFCRRFVTAVHYLGKQLCKDYDTGEQEKFRQQCEQVHRVLLSFADSKWQEFRDSLNRLDVRKALNSSIELRNLAELFSSSLAMHLEDLKGEKGLVESMDLLRQKMSMLCCGLPLHEAGIHCAVLEVKASLGSDLRTVSHAYQLLVDRHHPDKAGRTAAMGEIERANEELVKKENFSKYKADLAGLYQADLRALPETLKNEAMEALHDSDFERVKGFLEVIPELSLLPCGEDVSIRTTIHERIRSKFSHCLTSAEDAWEKQDLRRLDRQLKMIKSMSDSLSGCEDLLPSGWREDFESKLRTKVNQHDRAARDFLQSSTDEWDSNIKEFGRELVLLARIYDYLPEFASVASSAKVKIDILLDCCQGSSEGILFLFKLGMLLENGQCGDIVDGAVSSEDQRIAKQIVMDYRQFSEVRTVVWNQQTAWVARKDPSEIISEFKVQPDEASVSFVPGTLRHGYDLYKEAYQAHLDAWQEAGMDDEAFLSSLAGEAIQSAASVAPASSEHWDQQCKDQLPQILASVSAYFTISKSGKAFKELARAGEDEERIADPNQLLKQPHAVQILACLRMLGYDSIGDALNSHLLQVRTGEGKSVIEAICAVVLALLGFKIHGICYSEYLTTRDYADFLQLFQAFKVQNRIEYRTINSFSEKKALAKGNLRKLTEDLLLGSSMVSEAAADVMVGVPVEGMPAPLNGEELLLVDEIDVFFGPSFYGQTYNQVAELRLPEARAILTKIWSWRTCSQQELLEKVTASDEYTALLNKLPGWEFIVKREVESMCSAVVNLDTCELEPHYSREKNRIGYKIFDSVDFDVSYGYTTSFQYLELEEQGKLLHDEEALSANLSLRVACGRLSYAELGQEPGKKTKIIGVSGTLSALQQPERQILEAYGLTSCSLMPSVYGAANFTEEHFVAVSDADHHVTIAREIGKKLERDRAVIVFFADSKKLKDFERLHCRKFAKTQCLLETQTHSEKQDVIKRATTAGQVTLTTAVFARGTDFFCNDRKVIHNGGVHVIDTHLPLDICEEVQTKGRTSRQGQDGSYQQILNTEDLKTMGIKNEIRMPDGDRSKLDQERDRVRDLAREKTAKQLEAATEVDKLTHKYFDAVLAGCSSATASLKELYEFIKKPTPGQSRRQHARLVCLSDATGSMSSLWNNAQSTINVMIRRIKEIGGNNFELLWVAYRDYSERDQMLELSGWTSDAQQLQNFVNGIRCHGGGDCEEAVEQALLLARNEHRRKGISRVILIGDAPPHFEKKGQQLSNHRGVVLETDYQTEAQELKSLGVPVHTFRVGSHSGTKETFQLIANETGGQFADLSPESLIHAVCTSVLMDIGGEELVMEYRERFQ